MKIPAVKQVDGMGLMLGIVFEKENKKAVDIVKEALDKGLLILTAKDKLRMLPPLTITYDEIDEGISILDRITSYNVCYTKLLRFLSKMCSLQLV